MSQIKSSEESQNKKLLGQISAALLNKSKREAIFAILESNSRLSRSELVEKSNALQEDLARYVGSQAAFFLLTRILHLDSRPLDDLLKYVPNAAAKRTIAKMNAIYRPFFEAIVSPYPHDWYRLGWATNYDLTNDNPVLTIRIIKRNGESFFMETPLDDFLRLVNYLLNDVENRKATLSKLGIDLSKSEPLKETKKLVDSMTEPEAHQQPGQQS
jgi:hypothetical protein